MIVDTHTHVFSPDEEHYPISDAARERGDEAWFRRKAVTGDGLLADMDEAGVTRAMLVHAFSAYGYDNRFAIDEANRLGERLRALCTIAPDQHFADNVRACVAEPGVAGIRLFSWGQASNEWLVGPDAPAMWKVLADAGQVLDVAVGAEELPGLAVLAAQFPSMPIVVDHAAFLALGVDDDPATKNLFDLVALPNVNVKVTPLVFEHAIAAGIDPVKADAQAIERFGPERLLWGSNYTATALPSYKALVDQAQEVLRSFGSDVAEQISAGTANRLWWS